MDIKKKCIVVAMVMVLAACVNREEKIDKNKLLAGDYRLFQDTPAWELAKATQDENTVEIKNIIGKNKTLLNLADPVFGQTLLQLAVMNRNYHSVETLLGLGADPNLRNNYDGNSALMNAAEIGETHTNGDSRYLKLLLKHGGDPNLPQKNNHTANLTLKTPLLIACGRGNMEYVGLLLGAGANINYRSPYGETALYAAMVADNPDLVWYLLMHGADYRQPMFVDSENKKNYLTDALRSWHFNLNSEQYRTKMKIVDFLRARGMDYRKAPIPSFYYQTYDKDYLQKY